MNMFFFFPTTFHLPSFITVITAFLLAGLGIYEWMNYYLICWFRENCYSHLIYTLSWIHIYQTNYYFFILISFFDFFFLNSIQSGVNYQFIFSNIYFQFVHFLWRSVQWLRFSCKWKFTLIEQISICLFVWDLKAGYVVQKMRFVWCESCCWVSLDSVPKKKTLYSCTNELLLNSVRRWSSRSSSGRMDKSETSKRFLQYIARLPEKNDRKVSLYFRNPKEQQTVLRFYRD